MSSIGAAVEAAVKRLIRKEMKQALKGLRAEIRASGRARSAARPAASRGRRSRDDGPTMQPAAVKALRARLGMTQAQFAKTMGVTHVAVYFWESGRTKPTGPRLGKLRSLDKGRARKKKASPRR